MSRSHLSALIRSQVEKLTVGDINFGQHSTTSPIIIPQKPIRSNTSSQSSSSYTSVADQMFSSSETSTHSYRTSDDAWNIALPLECQRLEHSAARDRILVKNKRRQPIRQNLTTLRETDDNNQKDLIKKEEQENVLLIVEENTQVSKPQLVVDNSILDAARTQLRTTVRPRDHSADNILATIPISFSSIQRSTSFKRPEEINERKSANRFGTHNDEEKKTHASPQEHIYDNMDLFERHRKTRTTEASSNPANDSSTNLLVQTREQSFVTMARLRPVTMHIATSTNNDDGSPINEFENMFHQLKKRETMSTVDESSVPVEEPPSILSNENESLVVTTTSSIVKLVSVSPMPNRRKALGGVNLSTKNKIAASEEKPTPSWIDIAKQKQSKFQSASSEKNHYEELEPTIISRKPTVNTALLNENSSDNNRLNRKSMYEPVITRRVSPSKTSTNTDVVERESIRALKTGNSNRINALIQQFDK